MKKIAILLAALVLAWGASAKVELPEIFSDNLILQQRSQAKLWGWASPQTAVRVTTSWGAKASATSDNEGRWDLRLATPAGGYAPQRITVESGDRVVLNNVLIGEVWLASGQSNMEMPMRGFWNCPVLGATHEIATADAKRQKIHYVKIPKTASYKPEERVKGQWVELSSRTAAECSATAYYYARMLNEVLDVPVGIIDCSWGGSRVESWLPREVLAEYADVDLTEKGIEAVSEWLRPLVMYNAMLHPLVGFTIRGYIWYQGESNVGAHAVYAERFARMVAQWRAEWGSGELPFYYVEIAPFTYDTGDLTAALLREAQCKALDLIPASGMVSTNDLVEPYELGNIHPANKQQVGERLAYHALHKTYGMESVACESPRYKSVTFSGNCAVIKLDHVDNGYNRMGEIEGFEICGADRIFYPAKATITWEKGLVVASHCVPQPVAVRYGFRNALPGNLANTWGLPVIPFRTDDF